MISKNPTPQELELLFHAISEHKTIQYTQLQDCIPKQWVNLNPTDITSDIIEMLNDKYNVWEFRIKPETKYRPFNDAQEFIMAYNKHGMSLKLKNTYHPYMAVNPNSVVINKHTYQFHDLLEHWKFFDGTPCGILIEE